MNQAFQTTILHVFDELYHAFTHHIVQYEIEVGVVVIHKGHLSVASSSNGIYSNVFAEGFHQKSVVTDAVCELITVLLLSTANAVM